MNSLLEPPQHLDAERSVLASMLIDPAAATRALELLTPLDFYLVAHQKTFAAMRSVQERGDRLDLVMLSAELSSCGHLELAGGQLALAELTHYATTGANIEQHCRLVKDAATRRKALRLAESAHAEAREPGTNISNVLATLGTSAHELSRLADPVPVPSLDEQSETVELALERGCPDVESLVGNGLITRASITLLVSLPKIGKTYLALQLQRELAKGQPFLGFTCQQVSSTMIQLEMNRSSIIKRMKALSGLSGRVRHITRPLGWEPITSRRVQDELVRHIEKRDVRVMIFDPYRSLHNLAENSGDDQGRVMDAVRSLCDRTGVSVILLHHVNKLVIERGMDLRTAVLLSVRGSTRLISDPDAILGLVRLHGQTRLVFAGMREGQFEESIAIRQGDDGWFSVIDTPEQAKDARIEKIEKFLYGAGSGGMTVGELQSATGFSRAVVQRLVGTMDLRTQRDSGSSGRMRFFLPGSEPDPVVPNEPIDF